MKGFRKRLNNSRKVIQELIQITHDAGNDLIGPDGKEGKGRFVVYCAPKFEEVLSKNATIVPMPIIMAYLPPVYFRVFSRIVIGALNPTTMQSEKNITIDAEELLDSLSELDKPRFSEVIKFLIKYKFLFPVVWNEDGKETLKLEITDPYRRHYCATSVTAMSIIAKTHMANNTGFLDNNKYKWREWKKIKPIVINFDDLKG